MSFAGCVHAAEDQGGDVPGGDHRPPPTDRDRRTRDPEKAVRTRFKDQETGRSRKVSPRKTCR